MNVLDLTDARAGLATVGGKGASLARLARAGLPVPPGFHVTTHAYRTYVERHGRDFTREIPLEIARDIRAAYKGGPVAVRSSATAEDLPDLSFAGQQDTFLDVDGEDDLLAAVRRCWASLWNERAVVYRGRHGVDPETVAMAVVVQDMVPADAAGVMFTEDRGRLVINAARGLGEAVVSGQVTPDVLVFDRASRSEIERTIPGRREPALTEDEASRLVGLGMEIEALYGHAMDVEWAVREGGPYILQARPVTGRLEEWNDSLLGDYLWTNGNLGEAIPSVMTPSTWSLVKMFMADAMVVAEIGGHPICGNIGGRFYMNLSLTSSIAAALGARKLVEAAQEPVFGRLPEGITAPLLPMTRWQIIKELVKVMPARLRLPRYARRLPAFVRAGPGRVERLRAKIAQSEDLPALWRDELEPYFVESNRMLAAAGRQAGGGLIFLRRKLESLVGEADANALTSGIRVDGGRLESLGPLLGLARLQRGEIDRETFARRYGHRGPDEFELSAPRSGEDPDWIDRLLAGLGGDPTELLGRQDEVSRAAWRRFAELHPRQAVRYRRGIDLWGEIVQAREEARSEVIRCFWALRDFILRGGQLTGRGDDLFLLTIDEIMAVLRGDERPLIAVERRRRTYEHYKALPQYPAVIRGRFEPERWAADPDRRSDVFDERAAAAPAAETITGFAGAAGVVEGVARVIASVEEGGRLQPGEILVTTVTNIGWTPLFPRAAAVVTDVGAPLSHAAIVARELGIPAVVGTGNATMRVRDGDTVRVDGGRGIVEVLERA